MSTISRPVVAITVGDPAGIGPEIVRQAVIDNEVQEACRPLIVGHAAVLQSQWHRLGSPQFNLRVIRNVQQAMFVNGQIDVLDVGEELEGQIDFGNISGLAGMVTIRDTEAAIQLALEGKVSAVVAGPHTKKSVEQAGLLFDGYPSLVARITKTQLTDTFLMLVTESLRVVNVTLHTSLRTAVDLVKRDYVFKAIDTAAKTLKALVDHPITVAVTGLNPHAGEFGLFGREEIDEIIPAIEMAKTLGLHVVGPVPADTLFQAGSYEDYDICVAMYHDQAHIPVKMLGIRNASAFTIGAPVIFATVAHGSALDIAGKGLADPTGFIKTICRVTGQQ